MRNFVIYYHIAFHWSNSICRSMGNFPPSDHPDSRTYTNLKIKRVL